jgi:hypothetical protein
MYLSEFCSESLKERDHLQDLGVDGRKILKEVLKEYGAEVCSDLICSGQRLMAFFNTVMKHIFIKGGKFLTI